uniref:asparagine--tRNA ligase n=2 Tax=Eptatretus burgeri TaxID=7764 RepID=A0A8C4NJ11_EPTBU
MLSFIRAVRGTVMRFAQWTRPSEYVCGVPTATWDRLTGSRRAESGGASDSDGEGLRRLENVRDVLRGSTRSGRVLMQGWVQGLRVQKDVLFVDVSDGSCSRVLQVIADPSLHSSNLTFGSAVEVEGRLQASPFPAQPVEIVASSIVVLGTCDPLEYPLKRKHRYSLENTRRYPHLRCRDPAFAALLRLRAVATSATHKFFQDQGYLQIHTPILTSNDCEGAGELFHVQSSHTADSQDARKEFFNSPAYLTVSGQLHLEVMAGAFRKVYTFGPTFRADSSQSRRHLAEFHMVEAEISFTQGLQDVIQEIEGLYCSVVRHILTSCSSDLELLRRCTAPEHKAKLDKLLSIPFKSITYSEAIDILQNSAKAFHFVPDWGKDLQREHELYLATHCGDVPVFVTDWPRELKPFYARQNETDEHSRMTVASVDLLVPDIGEVCGGSLREERESVLQERLNRLGLLDSYQWYLDLRKYGSVPHGGFGLGFERLLQNVLGIPNIRDVIPFPRLYHSCPL